MNAGESLVLIVLLTALLGGAGAGACYGCPHYAVYQQRLDGEAQLAHSMAAKQVAIQEAYAKMESAKLLARAEVERAKGVAEANKIIGDSLKDNDAYLRYLWIQELDSSQNTVVYVPTEVNLPILEAGRLKK